MRPRHMVHRKNRPKRVLAIAPIGMGFGYAVFEGPLSPLDWGVRRAVGNKNVRSLRKIAALFDWYRPDVVVVENYAGEGSRRGPRIQRLIRGIVSLAEKKNIRTEGYSRADIRACFVRFRACTKEEIARAIVEYVPELQPRLPPPRKIWMSEDARMSIFDAASLIFTFYHVKTHGKGSS